MVPLSLFVFLFWLVEEGEMYLGGTYKTYESLLSVQGVLRKLNCSDRKTP